MDFKLLLFIPIDREGDDNDASCLFVSNLCDGDAASFHGIRYSTLEIDLDSSIGIYQSSLDMVDAIRGDAEVIPVILLDYKYPHLLLDNLLKSISALNDPSVLSNAIAVVVNTGHVDTLQASRRINDDQVELIQIALRLVCFKSLTLLFSINKKMALLWLSLMERFLKTCQI